MFVIFLFNEIKVKLIFFCGIRKQTNKAYTFISTSIQPSLSVVFPLSNLWELSVYWKVNKSTKVNRIIYSSNIWDEFLHKNMPGVWLWACDFALYCVKGQSSDYVRSLWHYFFPFCIFVNLYFNIPFLFCLPPFQIFSPRWHRLIFSRPPEVGGGG